MSNRFDRRRNKWIETKKVHTKHDQSFSSSSLEVSENELEVTVFLIDHDHIHAKNGKLEYSFMRHQANTVGVVIGDKLVVRDKTIIGLLPRYSFLARMRGDRTRNSEGSLSMQIIVANVDVAVIVASVINPDFHPRFIDRYLIACQNGKVKPVICINKIDLTDVRDPILTHYRSLGISVVEVSVKTGKGMEELKGLITGCVSVVVGNSGVGKSSIINAFLGEEIQAVNEISLKLGKGTHTTTNSSMHEWRSGSFIIDTPGIRALGLENLPKNELQYYFPEFEKFRDNCKYSNCLHVLEPGCAVKDGVEAGLIKRERYDSYERLLAD